MQQWCQVVVSLEYEEWMDYTDQIDGVLEIDIHLTLDGNAPEFK